MLPGRMNTTTLRIRRLVVASSVLDAEFNEPASGKSYAAEEDFVAQVRNPRYMQKDKNFGGNVPDTKLILVYRSPTNAANRLKVGDKLVGKPNGSGGTDTVDLVVVENKPIGHLPNPLLWMARLANNEDVKESSPAER